jgi:hypothetical protein
MRHLRDRLQDILDAIAQIETEQAKGKAVFEATPSFKCGWCITC